MNFFLFILGDKTDPEEAVKKKTKKIQLKPKQVKSKSKKKVGRPKKMKEEPLVEEEGGDKRKGKLARFYILFYMSAHLYSIAFEVMQR